MKIRELLTDESKWTKYEIALNSEGYTTPPDSDSAVCWCLAGSVKKCYPDYPMVIIQKIAVEIYGNIPEWNDAPERTFEEVKQLVEKLDI